MKYQAPYELKKAHRSDTGFDIRSTEDVFLGPMDTEMAPTGLRIEFKAHYAAQVRPRSSLSKKGLLVHLGALDEGFQGQIVPR